MFGRKRGTSDFSAEIAAHVELETERLRAEGMSALEAHDAACRRFGNVTHVLEGFYEASHALWWERFWQDVRYGARVLRKTPGFAAIAILTIALGVGATTAIFSVVDAVLLHPLPFPHPEQLVNIEDDLPGVGAQNVGMSVPEWKDFQRSGIFEYVSQLSGGGDINLTGASKPARFRFYNVAPNYFALIGVTPELGRAFNPDDPTPGFTLEVVISNGLWKSVFGGDPHILGRSVRLDNDLYTIIGVMPAGYHDPGPTPEERNNDIWAAANAAAPPFSLPARNNRSVPAAIGRLKPGLTLAEAQSRVDALVAALGQQYPEEYPVQSAWTVRLIPVQKTVVGDMRQSLVLLLGAVGLVLLIGCVNIANLLLARSSARGREMAVRQALGAARSRLTRQMLTESLLLSLLGGISGVAILFLAKGFLVRLIPDSLPRLNEISISWSVLFFALVASLAAGVVFGLAPALHAGRLDLNHVLKQEGRAATGTGEQARTKRLLAVTEFALSLILMISAGLLLRSFWDLLNVRPGFNAEKVMAVRTWLPVPNDPNTDVYRTAAQETPFLREVLRRVRALPGVEEAAIGSAASVPLGHIRNNLFPFPVIFEGHEVPASQAPVADQAIVSPEYFHLLRMTLLRGRTFEESDNTGTPQVAVVNEAFVRAYMAGADPLGKRFKLPVSGDPTSFIWTTVAGVIADARTESLAEGPDPEVFLSMYQRRSKGLAIFLRGHLDVAAIEGEVRQQVQSVNPELPVFGARTLDETVSDSLAERRFSMQMIGLFALTALLLAGLGIYGVISYLVSERTHEIGIRLALGAQRGNILGMVMREGLALALAGAAVGLVGALVVSHLMAGVLYGVKPTDPLTFAGVALLLIGVALLACYIPARRAIGIDPIVALRYE